MDDLAQNQVRIYPKEGLPYVTPRIHLDDTMRQMENDIQRVEYPKPAIVVKPPEKAPQASIKDKASLLGKPLKDNKVVAIELIEWIEKSKSIEDIGIVMKGETRKTVKDAAKERINKLL